MADVNWKLVADGDADVGGRATDLVQLGYSLSHAVKEDFPINRVPADVVASLAAAQGALAEAENCVMRLGDLMAKHPERPA